VVIEMLGSGIGLRSGSPREPLSPSRQQRAAFGSLIRNQMMSPRRGLLEVLELSGIDGAARANRYDMIEQDR